MARCSRWNSNTAPSAQKMHDDIQLAAQAMCLEDMLGRPVPTGAIYHASSRRRREVVITPAYGSSSVETADAIRAMLASGRLPPPVNDARCRECSLKDICQPEALGDRRPGWRVWPPGFMRWMKRESADEPGEALRRAQISTPQSAGKWRVLPVTMGQFGARAVAMKGASSGSGRLAAAWVTGRMCSARAFMSASSSSTQFRREVEARPTQHIRIFEQDGGAHHRHQFQGANPGDPLAGHAITVDGCRNQNIGINDRPHSAHVFPCAPGQFRHQFLPCSSRSQPFCAACAASSAGWLQSARRARPATVLSNSSGLVFTNKAKGLPLRVITTSSPASILAHTLADSARNSRTVTNP
jgi:hypothetical protein